jgi:hypothetical protein
MNTIEGTPKPDSFLSKRRIGWAGLAALLGCSAVCALPILATVGIGGGAAATIARVLKPGAEIIVAGVVFAGALGFMAVRFRARSRAGIRGGCGGACAIPRGRARSDSQSGLTEAAKGRGGGRTLFSRSSAVNAPVVCTADLTHAQVQIDGYRAVFQRLASAERFPGGFRWTFRAELGLESQLRGLAEREADCCRFFSYDLITDDDKIDWEVRGEDRVSSVLEEYFHLPERLREEPRQVHDVAALKRSAEKAGLGFSPEVDATGT